ncbi:MAG: CHASE2 domain-containing protein, partial [Desulfovibrionaceae bacterium]
VMAKPACGFFTTSADMDGVIRRVPLIMSWGGKVFPNLALQAILTAYHGRALVLTLSPAGAGSLVIGIKDPAQGKRKIEIPLDQRGQIFVNYRGPGNSFPYVSAKDVLEGNPAVADRLKDHIAFIGTSAAGLKDLRITPFDQYYPGVETHATLVDTILAGDFLEIPDWEPGLQIFAVLFAGVVTTLLLAWTTALWSAIPVVAAAVGVWFGCGWVFTQHRLFLSPLYSFVVLGTNFTMLTLIKFWREERQKRFIHGAFAHYLSPKVIEQIVDNPDSLSLEGEEKEITIMFSDVRSFTTLSEKLTPTQVTDLLHDYFTPMTRIITENSGTLDKFIGDAIMAFWNAPLDVPDHQKLAVRSALMQLDKLAELNELFKVKFGFPIAIGLGVNCGRVRVGNMGSADLFDYTLIGDNVNLASRLEGLTKFYGQQIVISKAVKEACGDEFVYQELDSVRVKGKHEPVTIFTVFTKEAAAPRRDELTLYDDALARYKAMDFAGARDDFTRLKQMHPGVLYEMYEERCEHLREEPPAEGWDGVYTHKTK